MRKKERRKWRLVRSHENMKGQGIVIIKYKLGMTKKFVQSNIHGRVPNETGINCLIKKNNLFLLCLKISIFFN